MYVNYNKVTDYTPESVLCLLETDDSFVERAIVALYKRQTQLEQASGCTIDDNERGMQQADAKLFGQYARQIMSGQHLSVSQLAEARRPWHRGARPVITVGKYRKQLVRMLEAAAKARLIEQAR
jgi:hypothetical protein